MAAFTGESVSIWLFPDTRRCAAFYLAGAFGYGLTISGVTGSSGLGIWKKKSQIII